MRIMFIVPRLSGGGAEKVIAGLSTRLSEKHKVWLITTLPNDGVEEYPVSNNIKLLNLDEYIKRSEPEQGPLAARINNSRPLRLARRAVNKVFPETVKKKESTTEKYIRVLGELKKKFRADCAISFLNSANYINAMSHGTEKCIVSVRSFLSGPYGPAEVRSEEGKEMVRSTFAKADQIVSVSEEIASELVKDFGADPEKTVALYNICDSQFIREKGNGALSADEEKLFAGHYPIYSTMGRMTEKKGQWHLIRAFSEVVKKYPKALLCILGREGKETENVYGLLKKCVKAFGLEKNVLFLGFHFDPYRFVSRGTAFVMSSFNEGFPNSIAEAMALGLPVISTDCSSGPREILAPETDCVIKTDDLELAEYGILVPQCSVNKLTSEPLEREEEILAKAMLLLAEDEELRKRYSQQGIKRTADFSPQKILSAWEELINKA